MKEKKQPNHVILFHIVSDRLLWLEARESEHLPIILSAGSESLIPTEEESQESQEVDLGKTIKNVMDRLHFGWLSKPAMILVAPNYRLSTRFMETPPTDMENVRELVSFEVSEGLQVSLDEIAWDMLISSRHGEEEVKHLIWVATRKNFIDSLIHDWNENGVILDQVTPDFWAIYEFLLNLEEESLLEPTVIVSREGEDRATITVANRRSVYLNRSVTLTRPGQSSDAAQKERMLSIELERTLTYVSDRFAKGMIHDLIICGFEDWSLEAIQETARKNDITMNHLVVDDVLRFFASQEGRFESQHLSLLCLAYCQLHLNIKGLNLLDIGEEKVSWKTVFQEFSTPSRNFLAVGGSMLALVFFLWVGGGIWYSNAVDERMNQGEDLFQLALQLQKEEQILKQMVSEDVNYGDILMFLSETLPKGVMVKSINMNNSQREIEIGLTGINHQRTIEIIPQLNECQQLRNVELDRSVNESGGFIIYLKARLV